MKVRVAVIGFVCLLLALVATVGPASAAIQYAGDPTGTWYWENGGTVGSEFHSNISASVIRLGVRDYGGDGLAGSHEVGLWDAQLNLIASATVAAGTVAPLENGYRWVTASASIFAGQHYVIGAGYYGAGVGDWIGTNAPINSAFTFVEDRDTQGTYAYQGPYLPAPGPGPQYPGPSDWGGAVGSPTAWFGPNLQVVPEPCSLIVWSLIGGFGIGGAWLRRKKRAV